MYSAHVQRAPIVIAEHHKPLLVRLVMVATFCLMFLVGSTSAAYSRELLRQTQTGMAVVQQVQQATEVKSLEVGQLISRELKGGQSHSYEISIAAGQYAHVVVDQKGIDVVVKLLLLPVGNVG